MTLVEIVRRRAAHRKTRASARPRPRRAEASSARSGSSALILASGVMLSPAVLAQAPAAERDAAAGAPASPEGGHNDTVYEGDTAQVVAEIKDLLDSRIRPAVAQDGGDIVFDRFDAESGTVWLHLRGACSGCPSSSATLKAGVENMLKHYVPEVIRVEQTL